MIQDNLEVVRCNIAAAAIKSGRRPQDITLVCVTKEAAIDQIKEAAACGVIDIGENRIQDAAEKYKLLGAPAHQRTSAQVKWHLIGHLQTNKVKKAVEIFDLIHSVDSLRLAEEISKESAKIGKVQDILIQVNTSGEESKFGIAPEELKPLIDNIVILKNIRLLGLMTIAPLASDAEKARPYFRKLRELLSEVNSSLRAPLGLAMTATQLSMGMSGDYQIAIEEGATMVRIGSAIFK